MFTNEHLTQLNIFSKIKIAKSSELTIYNNTFAKEASERIYTRI